MRFLGNPHFMLAMRWLFWLALCIAVVMAVLPTPPELPTDRFGDKFAHSLAFAWLAGLAALGFPDSLRWRIAERLSFLGALIEMMQGIPGIGRECDYRDWIADTLAVLAVTLLASLLLPRLRQQPSGEG